MLKGDVRQVSQEVSGSQEGVLNVRHQEGDVKTVFFLEYYYIKRKFIKLIQFLLTNSRGKRDSNPRCSYLHTRLAIGLFRPLRHHPI